MTNSIQQDDRFDPKLLSLYEVPTPSLDLEDRLFHRLRVERQTTKSVQSVFSKPILRWTLAATAIGLVAALVIGLVFMRKSVVESKSFNISQHTEIQIGQRAKVTAEADTSIAYQLYDDGSVEVEQGHGVALYQVEPGGAFVVATPFGKVLVTGTRFYVKVVRQSLRVNVEFGSVIVENEHGSLLLRKGQQALSTLSAAPNRLSADKQSASGTHLVQLGQDSDEQKPGIQVDDDPPSTLRLEGQVLDLYDLPVEGAIVALNSRPPRNAMTEKDGSFAFDKLVAKTYRISARKDQFIGGPVLHELTQTSDPAILRMRLGSILEVTVLSKDKEQPIAGATLYLRSDEAQVAVTDENGLARFLGVEPRLSSVTVKAAGFSDEYSDSFEWPIEKTNESGPIRIRISLSRGVRVAGKVVDESGRGVPGAKVLPEDAGDMWQQTNIRRDGFVTDEQGRFEVPTLAPGTYRFTANHQDYFQASSKPVLVDGLHPLSGIEIVFRDEASIKGSVQDSQGRPVPWAAVDLGFKDASMFSQGMGSRQPRQTIANEKGEFIFRGLPKEKMMLMASSCQGASRMNVVDLEVTPHQGDLVLKTIQGERIGGTVVNQEGDPFPEMEVRLWPDSSAWQIEEGGYLLWHEKSAWSDGSGRFEFINLRQGSYRLRAIDSTKSPGVWFGPTGVKAKTGDTDIKVVVGTEEDLGSMMSNATTDKASVEPSNGRTICGQVVDERGAVVSGATVAVGKTIIGDGNSFLSRMVREDKSFGILKVVSDNQGWFQIQGVDPDKTFAIAEHDTEGRSEMEKISSQVDNPKVVLVLHPYGSLMGLVKLNKKPFAGAEVSVATKKPGAQFLQVLTDDNGYYVVAKVQAGVHQVHVTLQAASGEFRTEDREVDIHAHEQAQLDFSVGGESTLRVEVKGRQGTSIDYARVILLPGKIVASTAKELSEQQSHLIGKSMDDDWRSGKAVRFENIEPGSYSVCVTPLSAEMSKDFSKQVRLSREPNLFKVYCAPVQIDSSPRVQDFSIEVLPMEPLPPAATK